MRYPALRRPPKTATWLQIAVGLPLKRRLAACIPTALLNVPDKLEVSVQRRGNKSCKRRNLSYSCCFVEEAGGLFVPASPRRPWQGVLQQSLLRYLSRAFGLDGGSRTPSGSQTWFAPSAGSSSRCSTENSLCSIPNATLNQGHPDSSKKHLIFYCKCRVAV